MSEAIVDNFNSHISAGDTLFHLGDVALGPWPLGLEYVKQISGHKILIPGNHDRVSSIESESRRERFRGDYEDAGFEILDEIEFVPIYDQIFKASHYPYSGDSHDGDRFEKIRATDDGTPIIHGHTHAEGKVTRSAKGTLQISVGVDAWGFRPVSEEEVFDIYASEGK